MGGGGAPLWFTAAARKRATCHHGRRTGFTGGLHTAACALGAAELLGCVEEKTKAPIGALGALRWRKLRDNCIVP